MNLRLDWIGHPAAKYAVEHWHYSRQMPAGKNVYLGVWEDDRFIGCVLFGLGSGNSTNGRRYGLARSHEIAELTRIALRDHQTPVSRIVKIALKLLRKQSPGIKLVTSMADPRQGHVGRIYQAGNWIYTGPTAYDYEYFRNGKWMHHRSAGTFGSLAGLPKRRIPSKFRYLMPFDPTLRAVLKELAMPYPQDASEVKGDTPANPAGKGGSSPTPTLEFEETRQDAI